MASVKRFDFHQKALDGLQTKSTIGGIVTIISGTIILILGTLLTISFIKVKTSTTIGVETDINYQIPTKLDMTFSQLNCEILDLHFENTKVKEPEELNYEKSPQNENSGCRFSANFLLNPGEGNFHIALSRASSGFRGFHSHFYSPEDLNAFNCSHVIKSLTFGPSFPGIINPLTQFSNNSAIHVNHVAYFIKLIPTRYVNRMGSIIQSTQYSVTEYTSQINNNDITRISPGVYFRYQLMPIRITIEESSLYILPYLTSLCSIIGGVITVSGIIQSLLTNTLRMKKRE